MRRLEMVFLGLSTLLASGCHSTERPILCVYTADESVTDGGGGAPAGGDDAVDDLCGLSRTATEDQARVRVPDAIGEEQIYFIRHDLPGGVAPLGELQIRVVTPCAEVDLDAEHVDGRVQVSGVAPRGASCSFWVSAVMANSELIAEVPGTTAACEALAAEDGETCAAPAR